MKVISQKDLKQLLKQWKAEMKILEGDAKVAAKCGAYDEAFRSQNKWDAFGVCVSDLTNFLEDKTYKI